MKMNRAQVQRAELAENYFDSDYLAEYSGDVYLAFCKLLLELVLATSPYCLELACDLDRRCHFYLQNNEKYASLIYLRQV